MAIFQGEILLSALYEMKGLSEDAFTKKMTEFMDDQPYLNGFLVNISDEFEDAEHHNLFRVAVMLDQAFKAADVPMRTIDSATINQLIEEKVADYENPESDGGENISSPGVFKEMMLFLKKELGEGVDLENKKANLNLIVEVLIESYELSAIIGDENDKKQQPDA